ncbi:unnamed protein product [Notodromas monacha]|uniref:VLIG-type G domain-containing protein n=1 Tax=Notodromas monacha TaxID=399045 RepID=A0A7R9BG54_9CRUS|nr:unnamed protein product [Notodromas monacha]CAG0914129.1 unnamed protein product [Notodromas monacha]
MILVTRLFGCPDNRVTKLQFGGLGIGKAKNCPGWRLDQLGLDNQQVRDHQLTDRRLTGHRIQNKRPALILTSYVVCVFSYLVILDTEGLNSPEDADLADGSKRKDNEMATFDIGIAQKTICNVRGEDLADLQSVLGMAAHAFIRMNKIKLSPSLCIALEEAHQNLMTQLDKSVIVSCSEDGKGSKEEKRFDDVVKFDMNSDIYSFPPLYTSTTNGVMFNISLRYGQAAAKLKSDVVKDIAKRPWGFAEFIQHIEQLWKFILQESHSFNFHNVFQLAVYNAMDRILGDIKLTMDEEFAKVVQDCKMLLHSSSDFLKENVSIAGKSVDEKFEELMASVTLDRLTKLIDESHVSFNWESEPWPERLQCDLRLHLQERKLSAQAAIRATELEIESNAERDRNIGKLLNNFNRTLESKGLLKPKNNARALTITDTQALRTEFDLFWEREILPKATFLPPEPTRDGIWQNMMEALEDNCLSGVIQRKIAGWILEVLRQHRLADAGKVDGKAVLNYLMSDFKKVVENDSSDEDGETQQTVVAPVRPVEVPRTAELVADWISNKDLKMPIRKIVKFVAESKQAEAKTSQIPELILSTCYAVSGEFFNAAQRDRDQQLRRIEETHESQWLKFLGIITAYQEDQTNAQVFLVALGKALKYEVGRYASHLLVQRLRASPEMQNKHSLHRKLLQYLAETDFVLKSVLNFINNPHALRTEFLGVVVKREINANDGSVKKFCVDYLEKKKQDVSRWVIDVLRTAAENEGLPENGKFTLLEAVRLFNSCQILGTHMNGAVGFDLTEVKSIEDFAGKVGKGLDDLVNDVMTEMQSSDGLLGWWRLDDDPVAQLSERLHGCKEKCPICGVEKFSVDWQKTSVDLRQQSAYHRLGNTALCSMGRVWVKFAAVELAALQLATVATDHSLNQCNGKWLQFMLQVVIAAGNPNHLRMGHKHMSSSHPPIYVSAPILKRRIGRMTCQECVAMSAKVYEATKSTWMKYGSDEANRDNWTMTNNSTTVPAGVDKFWRYFQRLSDCLNCGVLLFQANAPGAAKFLAAPGLR